MPYPSAICPPNARAEPSSWPSSLPIERAGAVVPPDLPLPTRHRREAKPPGRSEPGTRATALCHRRYNDARETRRRIPARPGPRSRNATRADLHPAARWPVRPPVAAERANRPERTSAATECDPLARTSRLPASTCARPPEPGAGESEQTPTIGYAGSPSNAPRPAASPDAGRSSPPSAGSCYPSAPRLDRDSSPVPATGFPAAAKRLQPLHLQARRYPPSPPLRSVAAPCPYVPGCCTLTTFR